MIKILNLLRLTLKGGQGSGNFGHAGVPGQVGGSASEDSLSVPTLSNETKNIINRYGSLSRDVNEIRASHSTSTENAASIKKDGFNKSSNSMYGVGYYFTNMPEKYAHKGGAILDVKLKPHNQVSIDMDFNVPSFLKDLGTDTLDRKSNSILKSKGIGSIRFESGDGDIYTLVFDKDLIEIN